MLLETISASHARLALRIIFIVLMGIVGWLAGKVLLLRAKLRVERENPVPVHEVMGFMQGFDLITSVWNLRQLPGGKIGYFAMVIVFILSKLTDLLTATLVQEVPVQSRCSFDLGLVFNTSESAFDGGYPPFNGFPYLVVQNAQIFSQNNSCSVGIYSKVNEMQTFCAQPQDTFGTWNCEINSTHTYPSETTIEEILSDLQSENLLYNNLSYASYNMDDNGYNHLVAWSSSDSSDAKSTVWSVQAAVQELWNTGEDIQMLPLYCWLDAPGAENIVSQMDSPETLLKWSLTYQGLMYYGTGSDMIGEPQQQLARLLNTIVMIQGGDNDVLNTPSIDADQTIGCISEATHIPAVVEALFLIVIIILLILFVLTLFYAQQLKRLHVNGNDPTEYLPGDIVEWASFAAQEHSFAEQTNLPGNVTPDDLKNWVVGLEVSRNERRLRVMPVQHNVLMGQMP